MEGDLQIEALLEGHIVDGRDQKLRIPSGVKVSVQVSVNAEPVVLLLECLVGDRKHLGHKGSLLLVTDLECGENSLALLQKALLRASGNTNLALQLLAEGRLGVRLRLTVLLKPVVKGRRRSL